MEKEKLQRFGRYIYSERQLLENIADSLEKYAVVCLSFEQYAKRLRELSKNLENFEDNF